MGALGDGADVVHGAEHVGLMPDRDEACRRREQLVERAQVEPAVVVDIDRREGQTTALCGELPRDDVAVVLHDGDDDAVARLEQLRRI